MVLYLAYYLEQLLNLMSITAKLEWWDWSPELVKVRVSWSGLLSYVYRKF